MTKDEQDYNESLARYQAFRICRHLLSELTGRGKEHRDGRRLLRRVIKRLRERDF